MKWMKFHYPEYKFMKHKLVFIFFIAIVWGYNYQDCPQLCTTCANGDCQQCYPSFTANAQPQNIPPDVTCGCPEGFYFNRTKNICHFCPVRCKMCDNQNECSICEHGYHLLNGTCEELGVVDSTGITQFSIDLDDQKLSEHKSQGFYKESTGNTDEINYFRNCGGQEFYGVGILGWNSILTKIYYGLPKHKYVQIKFNYLIQDDWRGQQFIFEVSNGRDSDPEAFSLLFQRPFSYDNRMRQRDLCQLTSFPESFGTIAMNFVHKDSILKFRIRTSISAEDPANLDGHQDDMYFAIRDMLLVFGDCPKHCEICASSILCGLCTSPYQVFNGQCVCNTAIAIQTAEGHCIKCQSNQIVYSNKCIRCEAASPGCYQCQSNGTCAQCSLGFFLNNGKCYNHCPQGFISDPSTKMCLICPTGCSTCTLLYPNLTSTTHICQSCSDGYIWYQGQCHLQCPDGTHPSLARTSCKPCPVGCLTCTSVEMCTSCSTSNEGIAYQFVEGRCKLICQSSENLTSSEGQIIVNGYEGCPEENCPLNCVRCFGDATHNCLQCDDSYFLQDYQCVDSCSEGYYKWFDRCEACPQACSTCSGVQGFCSQCQQGFWLFEGYCMRDCPKHFYHSSMNGQYTCEPCDDPLCSSCMQSPLNTLSSIPSICIECLNGLFLHQINETHRLCAGQYPECSLSEYLNEELYLCLPCSQYCEACEKGELCLQCESGKFLNNGQCVEECPYSKHEEIRDGHGVCIWDSPLCEQYSFNSGSQQSLCIQCIHLNPSLILMNGQCLFSCPDGYTRSSLLETDCTVQCPSNCIQCDSNPSCFICEVDFLLHQGSCISSCPSGYVSDGTVCLKCALNCLHCQLDGTCVECDSDLLLSPQGYCYEETCTNSYELTSGSGCTTCYQTCASCTESQYECTSCITDHYLSLEGLCYIDCDFDQFMDGETSTCRPCPSMCSQCNSPKKCLECVDGYVMLELKVQTSSNTTVVTHAQCLTECPVGYFIMMWESEKYCQACTFPCRTCFGESPSQCLDCVNGYVMQQTTCVEQCPSHKYADVYGHCEYCNDQCQECFGPASFQCLSCKTSSYFLEWNCYENECPMGYSEENSTCIECSRFLPSCLSCSNNQTCLLCQVGYTLYSGECFNNCPAGTFTDITNTTISCLSCGSEFPHCELCQSSRCLRCTYPYIPSLQSGRCVIDCESGTVLMSNIETCTPCSQECALCPAPSYSCISCKHNFYLSPNSICLPYQCQEGYYYNASAIAPEERCFIQCFISHCKRCSFQQDNSTEYCLICEPGYLLAAPSMTCISNNTACPSGTYLSFGICEPCHLACSQCQGSPTQCTNCTSSQYVLKDGLCIKYENETVNPHPLCQEFCALCADETSCIVCSLPTYLDASQGNCVNQCPVGSYPDLRQCKQCMSGCEECDNSATQCTHCHDGLYLMPYFLGSNYGYCVEVCPEGSFGHILEGQCMKCGAGCQSCSQDHCIKCESGRVLVEGVCQHQCPLTTMLSVQLNTCLPCIYNCLSCSDLLTCHICALPYKHHFDSCVHTCPPSTFESTLQVYDDQEDEMGISIQCLPCTPPCLTCLNQNTCLTCVAGFVFSANACHKQCPEGQYADEGTCQHCSSLCRACKQSNNQCTSCIEGMYLLGDDCVRECPTIMYESGDGKCQQCGSYCMSCLSQSDCAVCLEGFYLLQGSCVERCPSGYTDATIESSATLTYNHILHTCIPCPEPCKTCNRYQEGNQYQCLSCMIGLYLYEDKCLVKCPAGYFPHQTTLTCRQCHDRCETCTSYNQCLTCRYSADDATGQCLQKCEDEDTVCLECEQNQCEACDRSTAMNGNGTCISCYSGLLLYESSCVESCPDTYYPDSITGSCQICPCLSCLAPDQCTRCNAGQYLYAGKCYHDSCPTSPQLEAVQTYNDGTPMGLQCRLLPCLSRDQSGMCISCIPPYLLFQGLCHNVDECPTATYLSPTSNQCLPCPISCSSCTSSMSCMSCNLGYMFVEETKKCVQVCPIGFFSANSGNCEMCAIADCWTCSSAAKCELCHPQAYLLEINNQTSSCLEVCPTATFPVESPTKKCVPCSPVCRDCLSLSACTSCHENFFFTLQLNSCSQSCPFGFYPVVRSATVMECMVCPGSCRACLSLWECTICKSEFHYHVKTLSTGDVVKECIAHCPKGTYLNPLNNMCEQCVNECEDCIFNYQNLGQKCLTCMENYFLNLLDHRCYQQCPEQMYEVQDGYCDHCAPQCATCSISNDNCTSCHLGFQLTTSGMCISHQCHDDLTTYYSDYSLGCEKCSSQCYECMGPRFDQCLSCQEPLLFWAGFCLSHCPHATVDLGGVCRQCSDPACQDCEADPQLCTKCSEGMMLIGLLGICVKECPVGWYFEPAASECVQCLEGCEECEYDWELESVNCVRCGPGLVRVQYQDGTYGCGDQTDCSDNLFLNYTDTTCLACPHLCESCQMQQSVLICIQCLDHFILHEGKCISKCPTGSSLINSNDILGCVQCNDSSSGIPHCWQCLTDTDNSSVSCSLCLSPYFLHDSDCILSCPEGFIQIVNEQMRKQCKQAQVYCSEIGSVSYFDTQLGEWDCRNECPSGMYNLAGVCYNCMTGCLKCINSDSCSKCSASFLQLGSMCVSQCPSGYFPSNSVCYQCQSPCQACSSTPSECTSCIAGFFLFESSGQCYSTCPQGYYSSEGVCQSCLPQCSTCSNGVECTVCMNSMYSQPSCANTCASGEYMAANSTCMACHNDCSECFGASKFSCLSCANDKILMDGKCVTACPQGYYELTTPSTCSKCSSDIMGCQQCTFNSSSNSPICTLCQPPLLLSPASTCVSTCLSLNTATELYSPLESQCVECSENCEVCLQGVCHECNEAKFKLSVTNTSVMCVQTCPDGYYSSTVNMECLMCFISNCETCLSGYRCGLCQLEWFLFQGSCLSQCPDATFLNLTSGKCERCSANCNECESSDQCLTCIDPFLPDSSGTCLSCIQGYFYSPSLQTCKQCSSSCAQCYLSASNCTSCITGLFMSLDNSCVSECPLGSQANGTECEECSIANCTQCSGLLCFNCQSGYFLHDNQCVTQCPTQTYLSQDAKQCLACQVTHCDNCDISERRCTICESGYYLTGNGLCVVECPIGSTEIVSGGGILLCEQCSSGCKDCSNSRNTCDICDVGLSDQGDGTCSYDNSTNNINENCTSGFFAITLTNDTTLCLPCHTRCAECYGTTPTQCLSCRPGHTYTHGACIPICEASQFYNPSLSTCGDCSASCLTCSGPSDSQCLICSNSFILISSNNTCIEQCPPSTYYSNFQCRSCPQFCLQCSSSTFCTACDSSTTVFYSNQCLDACPTSTYQVTHTPYDTCQRCSEECVRCESTATHCLACAIGYSMIVGENRCVTDCPVTGYYANLATRECLPCPDGDCLRCVSESECILCNPITSALHELSCIPSCPNGTYQHLTSSHRFCISCPEGCSLCTDSRHCLSCDSAYLYLEYPSSTTCVSECPTGFQLITPDNICLSENCLNCATCVSNTRCTQCEPGVYLISSGCHSECYGAYYEDNSTWVCQPCMQNCLLCPSSDFCSQCVEGYNFSISHGNTCVDQSFLLFGALANMSGFTSNITKITSLVYLGTSVGPIVFGEMSATYFNIELCQFMFFHQGITEDNEEMNNFINSLSYMSMSASDDTGNNTDNSTGRRMLARRMMLVTDTMDFLEINIPIFILMGASLLTYLIVFLIHRGINSMCLSCPKIQFYTREICEFMFKRFKWIYFDFIAWISYIPFLYFAIMQVKKLGFDNALQGFSSIISVLILISYPLYPLLIAYQIKKNYKAVCLENDNLVEMSLSPWLWKVKRPETIPAEGEFVYCSKDNWKLFYYSLKYFRKFSYVLVLAICPVPIITLSILIALNVIFIVYMAVMRPRIMPYLVVDFIIEGVLLAFQIFILIYISIDPVKVSAMSIATHAIAFITANLTIIIAIILNLIAYYKIIMCLRDLYLHLKEKAEEKEKKENEKLKDQLEEEEMKTEEFDEKALQIEECQYKSNGEINMFDDLLLDKDIERKNRKKRIQHDDITEEDRELGIEELGGDERQITNMLADKDLVINGIQPRYDADIRISNNQNNLGSLFDDKELFGDMKHRDNGKYNVYDEGELPNMKMEDRRRRKDERKSRMRRKSSSQISDEIDESSFANLNRKEKERTNKVDNNDSEDGFMNSAESLGSQNRLIKNKIITSDFDQDLVNSLEPKYRNRDKIKKEESDQKAIFTQKRKSKFNNQRESSDEQIEATIADRNPSKKYLSDKFGSLNPIKNKGQDAKIFEKHRQEKDKNNNPNIQEAVLRERQKRDGKKFNNIENDFDEFQDVDIETQFKNRNRKFEQNEELEDNSGIFFEQDSSFRGGKDPKIEQIKAYEREKRGFSKQIDSMGFYDRKGKANIKQNQNQQRLKKESINEGQFVNRIPRNNESLGNQNNRMEQISEAKMKEIERKRLNNQNDNNGNREKIQNGKFVSINSRKINDNDGYSYQNPREGDQIKDIGFYAHKPNKRSTQKLREKEKSPEEVQMQERKKNTTHKDSSEFFKKVMPVNFQEDQIDVKDKKKRNKGKDSDGEFEDNYYTRAKKSNLSPKKKNGNLNVKGKDEFDEDDYARIKKKNAQGIFKPKNNPRLEKFEDESSIDEDGMPRRPSKVQRQSRNLDTGLIIDRRSSDVSDSEEFGLNSRKMRSKNQQRQRKKGNLKLNEQSGFVEEPEAVRKERESQKEETKRIKNAQLNILRRTDGKGDEDELDTVQL